MAAAAGSLVPSFSAYFQSEDGDASRWCCPVANCYHSSSSLDQCRTSTSHAGAQYHTLPLRRKRTIWGPGSNPCLSADAAGLRFDVRLLRLDMKAKTTTDEVQKEILCHYRGECRTLTPATMFRSCVMGWREARCGRRHIRVLGGPERPKRGGEWLPLIGDPQLILQETVKCAIAMETWWSILRERGHG